MSLGETAASQGETQGGSAGLSQLEKEAIIARFRTNGKDVGSPEVQVALLTARLEKLASHLEHNKKDYHSQRGMLRLVAHRKNLLQYLKGKSVERYRSLIGSLGLRK